MNAVHALSFDDHEHDHDYRDAMADDYLAEMQANEMIHLVDQANQCSSLADDLMLRACSANLRGRMLDTISKLQAEAGILAAQAHHFARHF